MKIISTIDCCVSGMRKLAMITQTPHHAQVNHRILFFIHLVSVQVVCSFTFYLSQYTKSILTIIVLFYTNYKYQNIFLPHLDDLMDPGDVLQSVTVVYLFHLLE